MAARKGTRRYGKGAARKVAKVMDEQKHGTLRSGSTGKKVTSRKQAVAIGLSEARRAGEDVPPNPNEKRRAPAKRKRAASERPHA